MATRDYRLQVWLALVSFLVVPLAIWLGTDPHANRYLPPSLDLLTLGGRELSHLLENGTINSVQLVEEYLRRIALDNTEGLRLRAILSLAPRDDLVAIAKLRDTERSNNATRSPLHGIPVLVKVFYSEIISISQWEC